MPLINFWQQTAQYRRASKSTEEKSHHHDRGSGDHAGDGDRRLLWQARVQMDETDWVEHTDRVMLVAEKAKAEFLQAQITLREFSNFAGSDPAQSGAGALE